MLREGIPSWRVHVTGNTVIDALLRIRRVSSSATIAACRKRIVLTMHRRESFGRPMEGICDAVLRLVQCNQEIEVVFPMRASPVVREPVLRLLGGQPRIHLIEPIGYAEFFDFWTRPTWS